jgi:hypothetical protein
MYHFIAFAYILCKDSELDLLGEYFVGGPSIYGATLCLA